jgi:hypothetical protein
MISTWGREIWCNSLVEIPSRIHKLHPFPYCGVLLIGFFAEGKVGHPSSYDYLHMVSKKPQAIRDRFFGEIWKIINRERLF